MLTSRLAPSSDLPTWALLLTGALALASLILLIIEMRRRENGGAAIVASGVLAILALSLAVLRPVRIAARESVVGARVIVLADASRSMALSTDIGGGTRADARNRAVEAIAKLAKNARFTVLGFGDGAPRALPSGGAAESALLPRSDLSSAIHALA